MAIQQHEIDAQTEEDTSHTLVVHVGRKRNDNPVVQPKAEPYYRQFDSRKLKKKAQEHGYIRAK